MSEGRRPSLTEINCMNKDELKKALKKVLSELDGQTNRNTYF